MAGQDSCLLPFGKRVWHPCNKQFSGTFRKQEFYDPRETWWKGMKKSLRDWNLFSDMQLCESNGRQLFHCYQIGKMDWFHLSIHLTDIFWAPTVWQNLISCQVQSDSATQARGLQHTRLLCLPLFPEGCSHLCPLSQWCCLTISSSASSFPCSLWSFLASRAFPLSWLFTSGG